MPQAVIVATARSPIGRAFKGSLVSLRPDDMSAQVLSALLAKVPQVSGPDVEDVIWGCASPAGEQGYNLARVTALLCGMTEVPGTTVNRYCSSSLQAVRMAAHAIAAGEGDVFVAGGVESVSRFANGFADEMPGTHNPRFEEAEQRTALRALGGSPIWEPLTGLPDIYIAMGQTAENVRQLCGVSREAMDRFAQRSQQRAVQSQDDGFFHREIVPLTLPDGTVVDTDDSPRRGTDLAAMAELKPAFRPDGEVTAGNSCPLNDGAAAVMVMSDERAATTRAKASGQGRSQRRLRSGPRDHGPRPGRGVSPGLGPGWHDDSRHRPGGDQRSLRRPGHTLRRAAWDRRTTPQCAWRGYRSRAPVRHDWRPDHDDSAQRARSY